MSDTRWEYKVAYVDRWERTSVEGSEVGPEEGERNSGFGRRFLNGLGADGWELVGIQHTRPGSAYYIFKRSLESGAEPDLSVSRRAAEQPDAPPSPPPTAPSAGPGGPSGPVVSL